MPRINGVHGRMCTARTASAQVHWRCPTTFQPRAPDMHRARTASVFTRLCLPLPRGGSLQEQRSGVLLPRPVPRLSPKMEADDTAGPRGSDRAQSQGPMGTDVDPMNAGKDEFFGDELGEAGVHADGVNLYDDLYAGEEGAAVLQERVDGLERTCAKQRKELGDARAELTRIQAENEALRKDRETLLKNISSVYLTAKGEIERLRGQVQRLSTELAVNRAKSHGGQGPHS